MVGCSGAQINLSVKSAIRLPANVCLERDIPELQSKTWKLGQKGVSRRQKAVGNNSTALCLPLVWRRCRWVCWQRWAARGDFEGPAAKQKLKSDNFRVARHLPRIRNRPGRERYGLITTVNQVLSSHSSVIVSVVGCPGFLVRRWR